LRFVKVLCVVVMLVALSFSASQAQVAGKWGVGGFVSYNKPLFTFGDRFSGGVDKWGLNMSYVANSQVTLEAEYHHATMDNGALETAPFQWSPKGGVLNNYTSKALNPSSSYTTKFNSVALAAQWHFNADRTMGEGSYSPYLVIGGGFYDHDTVANGIIWPGQGTADAEAAGGAGNVDADGNVKPSVTMGLQRDTRTALSGTVGLGLEAFLTPTIAVDMRARYHFVLGELRPYTGGGWAFEKTFPLQMMDLSVGFKFYFWD